MPQERHTTRTYRNSVCTKRTSIAFPGSVKAAFFLPWASLFIYKLGTILSSFCRDRYHGFATEGGPINNGSLSIFFDSLRLYSLARYLKVPWTQQRSLPLSTVSASGFTLAVDCQTALDNGGGSLKKKRRFSTKSPSQSEI
ncbi:hypothetical protein SeMB42_g07657 [Synchytrium endobioticum]|uniref:Uncharacterized protein n=1 Tax=Synchytrium endobioticum TaxID=286115 RepID=A0A507C244_9FUNG|nr:hypothetical protein SeMB42_g07657 [Synchytrium endobioticum]